MREIDSLSVVCGVERQSAPVGRALGACALVFAVLLGACSTLGDDKTAAMNPQKIYQEAKDEMLSGGWERAIPLLEKLEGRAAGTILAQQAQLDKAYAQYRSREVTQALATLDRFAKQHPASPAMDYALYLRGLVNFNDDVGLLNFISKQDLSERDQKASKESFDAFKDLVARFPDSNYAADARQRMVYIVNALARYEVHVARYYFTRGAYVAAIGRAQTALTEYSNVASSEDALYILVSSYDAMGLTQLRDDSLRVLKTNFPNSTVMARGLGSKGGGLFGLF